MAEVAHVSFQLYCEQIKPEEINMNEQDLINALGPLAPLYSDPTVQEIMVDAHDRVSIVRHIDYTGKLEDVASPFKSPEEVRAVIDAILALGGITLGPDKTIGETRFPDGSRFLTVLPPNALDEPCFVIRRFPTKPITWDMLLEFGAVSREAYEFFQGAIRAKVNILVAGGTGSGKTTLANRLAELVPPDERVIVVEEVYEMQVRHPRCLHLEAGGPANVSYGELVVKASCMRPDWLIVGELYGPEAMHALRVMSHGHTGLATMHANSVEDALAELEALCLMANMGLGLAEIRRMIASAIRLIAYQEFVPSTHRRRVTAIVELRGVENDRYVLQPLFRYNSDTDKLEATGVKPAWES
jgi:pilus assembly protein CpaF